MQGWPHASTTSADRQHSVHLPVGHFQYQHVHAVQRRAKPFSDFGPRSLVLVPTAPSSTGRYHPGIRGAETVPRDPAAQYSGVMASYPLFVKSFGDYRSCWVGILPICQWPIAASNYEGCSASLGPVVGPGGHVAHHLQPPVCQVGDRTYGIQKT